MLQGTFSPTPRAVESAHIAALTGLIDEAVRQGDEARAAGLRETDRAIAAGTMTFKREKPALVLHRAA